MEKDFVQHDRALRMKAIGFDEPCFGDYFKFGIQYEPFLVTSEDRYRIEEDNKGEDIYRVSAPTFSQAFRWFREKYNLIAEFNWHFPSKCYATSIYPNDFYLQTKSYEQAELACLDKLIEIVEGITESK